ncbi:MAG: hypothetical protein HYV77_03125 [Candidatus Wildermuthbacteria bacterium]|nr:hypothetical protein [Candidatus Wildermuthbacteria bacterium]
MKQFLLKHKATIAPIIGFGLAGLIWGLEAYRGTVGSNEVFTNPFSYILGAVAFGILGTGSLVLFSHNLKKSLITIGLGLMGWLVAFLLPLAIPNLDVFGAIFLEFILPSNPSNFITSLLAFTNLEPSLRIGVLFLGFLVSGLVVGTTYSLLFKINPIKIALYFSLGFSILSLITPILGNMVSTILHSLVLSYLFTFIFLGILLGFFTKSILFRQEVNE